MSNSSRSGPLTDHDYRRINDHLRNLGNTKAEIERAKEAGFECDPEDRMCQELMDRLTKLKAVYFPGRP